MTAIKKSIIKLATVATIGCLPAAALADVHLRATHLCTKSPICTARTWSSEKSVAQFTPPLTATAK
jgi:hypothetical protein